MEKGVILYKGYFISWVWFLVLSDRSERMICFMKGVEYAGSVYYNIILCIVLWVVKTWRLVTTVLELIDIFSHRTVMSYFSLDFS